MDASILLVLSLICPLVGAAVLWVVAPIGAAAVRWTALGATLLTFVLVGLVTGQYLEEARGAEGFAVWEQAWLAGQASVPWNVHLSVGLDGISLWLYGLTALLMVTAVLVSWRAIDRQEALYYGLLLLLETGCLGVFCARDLLLFYIFFEFTLIPLYFLIGIWGSEERRWAAKKFFLYTLAGSVLTFLSLLSIVLWVYQQTGLATFALGELTDVLQRHPLPLVWQHLVFWGLFAGFAIKVPLFPLHTWLPLAHVQAPTAGSVFLAGILLKMGTYGFLRLSIPMLPEATVGAAPLLLWLALAGIIYGALVALAQSDLKRLIAYSSVSHMGFCMLGLFALTPVALRGGTLQMINHGISTGALFAMVGMIYERYHTRRIADLGGLARRLPWLTFFFILFTLSSVGLPGTNGFAGEFLILIGMFQRAWDVPRIVLGEGLTWVSVLAVTGVILGAWYMLSLVRRVFFGPASPLVAEEAGHESDEPAVKDLDWRERLALAPLAVLVLWIGVWPASFVEPMAPALERLSRPAAALWAERDWEAAHGEIVEAVDRREEPVAPIGHE